MVGGALGTRLSLLGFALTVLLAAPALAERAWVKDEVTVYIRSGAGNQYRILGPIRTGDQVQILDRGDGWTQVRAGEREGWVPAGFLQPKPPARFELEKRDAETASIRQKLDELTRAESSLREENEKIAARDEEQRSEITRLTRENLELRSGARWPEWITGAGIVTVGMALGAILQRTASSRRRTPRIRL